MKDRIVNAYKNNFGSFPEVVAKAPGRINLIGEHTDYNGGWVLPAAIDKCMYFGISRNNSNDINLVSLDLKEKISVPIDKIERTKYLWADYILGNLKTLLESESGLGGFDLVFGGNIPIGSGMSSSAALECGFLKAISICFNIRLSNWEMIQKSQRTNHNFLGIKGGILDQFSSLMGEEKKVLLLNCVTKKYEAIPVEWKGMELLLVNSMVTHNHAFSAYNQRVQECAMALDEINKLFPNVRNLSDIAKDDLNKINFTNRTLKERAHFICDENNRVHQFVAALKSGDTSMQGDLLYASHYGLRDQYEVSCPELDFLVSVTENEKSVYGARMMGGGFGGCTLNFVQSNEMSNLKEKINQEYKSTYKMKPEFYELMPSDGACQI